MYQISKVTRPGLRRLVLVALLACLATADPAAAGKLLTVENPIPGSYLVKFKSDGVRASFERRSQRPLVATAARQLAQTHGGKVISVWEHALKGFAVRLAPEQAAALAADPRVAYVEPDQLGHVLGSQYPLPPNTWGLDRIDDRDHPLNSTFNYHQTGLGVHVYVLDSGIRQYHNEFTGRIGNGANFVDDGNDWDYYGCNGHGTHVAGVVGGTTHGVAKQATLHMVRIAQCDNEVTAIDATEGVNWVTANHASPAVANMSVRVDPSQMLDDAVRGSIASGVSYAVGAGNFDDACNGSPGRVAEAVTVAATQSNDERASYSSYGECVDIFAPGGYLPFDGGIRAASYALGPDHTEMRDGTSVASPHVAGAMALYRQANPNASPATVTWSVVENNSTPNKVQDPGPGSPNRLLFIGRAMKTVGVFRPGNPAGGEWFLNEQFDGSSEHYFLFGGLSQDRAVAGDWNGGGLDTVGVFRGGEWFLTNDFNNTSEEHFWFSGAPGEQPVAGDWDGDGIDTVGVFRPEGAWLLTNTFINWDLAHQFSFGGAPGDQAVAGDWDGDGIDTVGVFRTFSTGTRTTGEWFLTNDLNGTAEHHFAFTGVAQDRAVAGDWNGDALDTVGLFRNGQWLLTDDLNGTSEYVFVFGGLSADQPVTGNWSGNW